MHQNIFKIASVLQAMDIDCTSPAISMRTSCHESSSAMSPPVSGKSRLGVLRCENGRSRSESGVAIQFCWDTFAFKGSLIGLQLGIFFVPCNDVTESLPWVWGVPRRYIDVGRCHRALNPLSALSLEIKVDTIHIHDEYGQGHCAH